MAFKLASNDKNGDAIGIGSSSPNDPSVITFKDGRTCDISPETAAKVEASMLIGKDGKILRHPDGSFQNSFDVSPADCVSPLRGGEKPAGERSK